MATDREVIDAINRIANSKPEDDIPVKIVGTVKSVDENASTCIVVGDNEIEYECLLQAEVCDGLQIIPKVDSTVIIANPKYSSPYVVMFSDVDKFYLQVGDSSMTITNDGKIQLNDGSFGSLIKIQELVNKVNTIENDLNTLKTAFSGWTPVPNDGGAALKAAAGSWYGQQITRTQVSDIENKKITHGK